MADARFGIRLLLRKSAFPCGMLAALALAATWSLWLPRLNRLVDRGIAANREQKESQARHSPAEENHDGHDHGGDDHGGHDHGTDGHESSTDSIELSLQARQNLGLNRETVRPVVRGTFLRSITIPAVVVEQPGRTRLHVAAPMTGVITHVHAVEGETVEPGALLFEIRLTHEDLVQSQVQF
ncbi:MAG: hypothetical protein KDA96_17370, partial [Planctomycetaceae bacterium]|nr:hypothetical protein [Planctomycetaceae bacterium]